MNHFYKQFQQHYKFFNKYYNPRSLGRAVSLTLLLLTLLTACMGTIPHIEPPEVKPPIVEPPIVEPPSGEPSIVSTSFLVDEVAQVRSVIGTILAKDDTNQVLAYKILSGNTNSSFILDSVTGELRLNQRINHNVTPDFDLEIQVEDSDGFTDTKIITIAVNRYETVHNWRLLSSWISTYEIYNLIHEALNTTLVNELKALSDGQLNITIHPVDKVKGVGYLDVYDQVKEGQFELGHTASYWYTDKNEANAFFTSQPFGLSEEQYKAWLKADGQSLWNELNAKDNLIAFRAGTSGEKSIGWFNSPVTTPNDLNGLKWRIAGFGSEVARRAGANVIPTAALPNFREYATVLKDGTVDALRWSDPYSDWQLDLHMSDAVYYRGPDWSEQSALLAMYISLDTYNAMPIRLKMLRLLQICKPTV